MKKAIALLLAVFLAAGLCFGAVSAEAPENTNYLTHKWTDTFFPGELSEREEDGVTVTQYISKYSEPWFSPQLSVYDDLKKLAEGKEYIEVYFHIELRGVFTSAGQVGNLGFLFRAVDPRTGSYAYSVSETEDWDGQGNHWLELYSEALADGDVFFKIDHGGNVMSTLNPPTVTFSGDEWTVFESEVMYIPASALSDDLFGDIILCLDLAPNGYTGGLKGIEFRNTAIYDCNEHAKTPAPTEQPTEAPAATATAEAAAPTDAGATNATQGEPTAANATDPGSTKDKGGLTPGAIAAIVAGAVVVVTGVIIAVTAIKKKKNAK